MALTQSKRNDIKCRRHSVKDGLSVACKPVSTAGKIIEPQEYKPHLDAGEFDSHNVLAAASFAIVNGIISINREKSID